MKTTFHRFWQVFVLFLFLSCSKDSNDCIDLSNNEALNAAKSSRFSAEAGTTTVMYMAEYLTSAESGKLGQTIYFWNVGNKQLNTDFVPVDPRRGGRVNITYAVDDQSTSDNGLTLAQTTAAIDNAMATWDAQTCSNLNMTKVPFSGDLGFVSLLFGFGGNGANVADVQHSGWLPAAFFDSVAPDGSDFILGVTFTIIFVTDAGQPTDIDGNGLADVAFREIYYNDAFTWRANSGSGIDIESVALHESGHGLSQGHFGKGFETNANGKLHLAPRAVMNAAYTGVLRSLLGSDNGGHCSNWASWPSN